MDLNLISSNEMTDSFQFTSNVATTSGPVQVEVSELFFNLFCCQYQKAELIVFS